MKTKTTRMKTMIGMFALLTVTVVFSIATAPAMAGPPHLDSSALADLMSTPAGLGVSEILDSLALSEVIPGLTDDLVPDEGPFPDGGDWGPVFPDGGGEEDVPADDAADDALDDADDGAEEEVLEEEPAEDAGDEAVEEVVEEEPTEDAGDEAVEEEPVDEGTTDTTIDEATDEAEELPYTGGDSLLWIIGGAGLIFLAGAVLVVYFSLRAANR